MSATPVIAIFDIGKTNKKLFLFDEAYKIVHEETTRLDEITDEDGDPCEDLKKLQAFVFSSLKIVQRNKDFRLKAVNFSAYGASFVNVNKSGAPATPLYNYLKQYPQDLLQRFYAAYGGEQAFSALTASPVLGHLNSGMQLYWLKHKRPALFNEINCSLHLPQYFSYLLTNKMVSEKTSIGCHTNLWNFLTENYHDWVNEEGIFPKLAPLVPSTTAMPAADSNANYLVGVGLHDSSAALIPYLAAFQEPFVLLSTGTWCISLNPFNPTPLTAEELAQDCLCYLTYEGKPVKASRLFAGNAHELGIKKLAVHFNKAADHYKTVKPDMDWMYAAKEKLDAHNNLQEDFEKTDIAQFSSYEEAYHALVRYIVSQQVASMQLALKGTVVKRIFVDGGFGRNEIFMYLLAASLPEMEVFAASMAQATALGAALAIHSAWNSKHLPANIVELKYYATAQRV